MSIATNNLPENQESAQPQGPSQQLPPGAAQRALRGRGRGMPRR
jgi:T-complex protein 1 subunit eta